MAKDRYRAWWRRACAALDVDVGPPARPSETVEMDHALPDEEARRPSAPEVEIAREDARRPSDPPEAEPPPGRGCRRRAR